MPNDDLGTFPMPPQTPVTPTEDSSPIEPTSQPSEPQPPQTNSVPFSDTPPASPQIIPDPTLNEQPQSTSFEATPDEIPSFSTQSSSNLISEQEKIVETNENLIFKQSAPEDVTVPEPVLEPASPTPTLATLPPKTGNHIAPIIIVVLLVVAGLGLASAAFLSAQTNKLKTQLSEITQTLEKQETILTPTPTQTVFEIPTPTNNPNATESSQATPSALPTLSLLNSLQPLVNASSALQIAINHSPNAQLILIKIDNALDPTTSVTKYFFRESLNIKKYFYVAITNKGIPEIIDKQIYVTPDDNIPSLNDTVLTDKLGFDLDEIMKFTYTQCANQISCSAAPVKAQYIKTGTGIIWQISLYTNGLTSSPLLIQIDAQTKAVLYKSPEFSK